MAVEPIPDVPMFEGKPVSVIKLRVALSAGLPIDEVLRMDDIVRIVVEARVSQVNHNVNERTGELERVQTVKAVSVEVVPWNPNNPTDRGVLRG